MTGAGPASGARLARALLDEALRSFRRVPAGAREPGIAAIDRFLADPGPSLFLAAVRQLRQLDRRVLLESTAATTLRRGRDEGLEALRAVPGFPPAITERLAEGLPLDPRGGQRLLALAALARAYEALAGQVAADTVEMRDRLRALARRSGRGRTPRARG
jgi:hypothetical protein